MFDEKEHILFWKKSGERAYRNALLLFKNKRYDSSLFFCHLALEKMLKGLFARRKKKAAPYTHDLAELAQRSNLKPKEEILKDLRIINTFNISGRYDSVKFDFYKRCTKAYAQTYMKRTKALLIWLRSEYQKK